MSDTTDIDATELINEMAAQHARTLSELAQARVVIRTLSRQLEEARAKDE